MVHSKRDVGLLFATRSARMFAYGALSVMLALYLAGIGLAEQQIGLLFTLTLAGDAAITLILTTSADRLGRRRSLMLGGALMALAGTVFLMTRQPAGWCFGVAGGTGGRAHRFDQHDLAEWFASGSRVYGCAVLSGRWFEDRLRPAVVPQLPRHAAAGGADGQPQSLGVFPQLPSVDVGTAATRFAPIYD